MKTENLISIDQLCTYYKVEMSFFNNLKDYGLIEISTLEQTDYIHQDKIEDVEKVIRMHQELEINLEGIDTILHLLEKINDLQSELVATKNRLRLYEDDTP